MNILNFKEINKGCLQSAFDINFEKLGMTVKSFTIFKKDGRRWIGMPNVAIEGDDKNRRKYFVRFEQDRLKDFEKKIFEMIDSNEYTKCEDNSAKITDF